MSGASLPDDARSPDPLGPAWLTRERMRAGVLAVATLGVFYLCYLLVQPFLPSLAWALALAVVAHPMHAALERRLHRPNLAATVSVAVVALVIGALSYFVVERLVSQVVAWAGQFPQRLEGAAAVGALERVPVVGKAITWLHGRVDLRGPLEQTVRDFTAFVSSVVAGSLWSGAQFFITFFVLFYFLRDRQRVLHALRRLLPLSREEADEMFGRVARTIHATIYGTLMVATVQGALGGLMFWWLGLPMPVLWGVVMALLAIIPVLGAFIVWVPAALILLFEGAWVRALVLAAWGSLVVGVIDNLLYPVFVGRRLSLHTVPVFFAVVGGLFVFGASGLILGPVVLALADALAHVWSRRAADA